MRGDADLIGHVFENQETGLAVGFLDEAIVVVGLTAGTASYEVRDDRVLVSGEGMMLQKWQRVGHDTGMAGQTVDAAGPLMVDDGRGRPAGRGGDIRSWRQRPVDAGSNEHKTHFGTARVKISAYPPILNGTAALARRWTDHRRAQQDMDRFLIIYSTTDGHTREICERMAEVIAGRDHEVNLKAIEDIADDDTASFDKLILGASIRYGHHGKAVYRFIRDHARLLSEKPSAFFSVNLVARKPEKRQPDTNPYVRRFLREIPWQPRQVAVFAGKLDYPHYRFWDRQIIRLIMWITKGPTDPATVKDFTDWSAVDAFAQELCRVTAD